MFCRTVPNHFVEESFCVSERFGYRKKICLRGEYHNFLVKRCCLKVPKNFVGEPISLPLTSGVENFLLEMVMSRFSIEGLLSQTTDKLRSGTPLCSKNILVSKKNIDEREGGR